MSKMKKTRKPGGGRKKLKPEYDAGKNLKDQMGAAVALYEEDCSLQSIADVLNLNPIKVRKLLITAGVYESEVAEEVQDTFERYRKTQDYKTSILSTATVLGLIQKVFQNTVPLFGVLIEHQVTTHDVGVVTGKMCFDKGLCNALPVFCNEHQAGQSCTDIFCDFKIVGEHSVAEQLTADPVRRAAGNIQQILQLIRLHLMLDHDASRILAKELTASLRRSQHLCDDLTALQSCPQSTTSGQGRAGAETYR